MSYRQTANTVTTTINGIFTVYIDIASYLLLPNMNVSFYRSILRALGIIANYVHIHIPGTAGPRPITATNTPVWVHAGPNKTYSLWLLLIRLTAYLMKLHFNAISLWTIQQDNDVEEPDLCAL